MIKRIFLVTLVFFSVIKVGFSQNDSVKNNSVFYELGGFAVSFSLNYDRNIHFNDNTGIALGVGFSPELNWHFSPRLPIHIKLFYQIERHTIEGGIAFVPYFYYHSNLGFKESIKETQLAIWGQIGYKYSLFKDKYYIGVAFTPILVDNHIYKFKPELAIRFGYKF